MDDPIITQRDLCRKAKVGLGSSVVVGVVGMETRSKRGRSGTHLVINAKANKIETRLPTKKNSEILPVLTSWTALAAPSNMMCAAIVGQHVQTVQWRQGQFCVQAANTATIKHWTAWCSRSTPARLGWATKVDEIAKELALHLAPSGHELAGIHVWSELNVLAMR